MGLAARKKNRYMRDVFWQVKRRYRQSALQNLIPLFQCLFERMESLVNLYPFFNAFIYWWPTAFSFINFRKLLKYESPKLLILLSAICTHTLVSHSHRFTAFTLSGCAIWHFSSIHQVCLSPNPIFNRTWSSFSSWRSFSTSWTIQATHIQQWVRCLFWYWTIETFCGWAYVNWQLDQNLSTFSFLCRSHCKFFLPKSSS